MGGLTTPRLKSRGVYELMTPAHKGAFPTDRIMKFRSSNVHFVGEPSKVCVNSKYNESDVDIAFVMLPITVMFSMDHVRVRVHSFNYIRMFWLYTR